MTTSRIVLLIAADALLSGCSGAVSDAGSCSDAGSTVAASPNPPRRERLAHGRLIRVGGPLRRCGPVRRSGHYQRANGVSRRHSRHRRNLFDRPDAREVHDLGSQPTLCSSTTCLCPALVPRLPWCKWVAALRSTPSARFPDAPRSAVRARFPMNGRARCVRAAHPERTLGGASPFGGRSAGSSIETYTPIAAL